MKIRATRLLLLILGLAILAVPAWANDQKVVIGAGLGIHSFSQTDDVRKGSALFDGSDELKRGLTDHLYVEWYALDTFGIGARVMAIAAARTYSGAGTKLEQLITISSTLLTANWVPIGSEDYVRFGFIGGIGPARYELKEKYTNDFTSSQNSDDTASASGSATLLGGYVDWGGEDFGARFGIDLFQTNLDKLNTPNGDLTVDGSGLAWYFDLRWAFN